MTSLMDGRPIAVNLRLLDHQIIGSEGELMGKVDDLLLAEQDGHLVIVALLSGPPALARRQGGRSEIWLDSIWRRLRPESDPVLEGIGLDAVTELDSAVHVDAAATRWLGRSQLVERWLNEHVITRLPGKPEGDEGDDADDADDADGGHGSDGEGSGGDTTSYGEASHGGSHDGGSYGGGSYGGAAMVVRAPLDAAGVSGLLGARVRGAAGEPIGEVIEVIAEPVRTRSRLGPLRVTSLVCSGRRLGNELGFTLTPQPPAALRSLMRRVHRDDVLLDIDDVSGVDDLIGSPRSDRPSLVLRSRASTPHPHDVTW